MGEDEFEVIEDPVAEEELEEDLTIYRTYRMDVEKKRIIGMVDGAEASQQAMMKALQTRRFAYLIYDDQYGSDIYNKVGNQELTPGYLRSDIPAMVEDAFLNNEEILGISDLSYEILEADAVHISFTASTIYGDEEVEEVLTDG